MFVFRPVAERPIPVPRGIRYVLRMNPTIFPFLAVSTVALFTWPSSVQADPGQELALAYEKLHASSYRKREIMSGAAALGAATPVVTEHVADRSRMVVKTEVPSYGRIYQERVTVGSRAAVRTVAPGVASTLGQTKRRLTANSAMALLHHATSAGAALSGGGSSRAGLIGSVVGAAAVVSSTAQAQHTLDNASDAYSTWQLVPEEEERTADEIRPEARLEAALAAGTVQVEKSVARNKKTITYTSRSDDGGVVTVVTVNAKSGLPASEEIFLNQQRMARVEYFDYGAPITIEVPECLQNSSN